MEKVYQAVGPDGLRIPLELIRQYGLEQGSGVVVELEAEGIRIFPARPDRSAIENRALRYLLSGVGDAATVEAIQRPDDVGWQVNVYGAGMSEPVGVLFYSPSGTFLSEKSTSVAELRRVIGPGGEQP